MRNIVVCRVKTECKPRTDSVRSPLGGFCLGCMMTDGVWVERALERDHFMTAEEALAFGLVDRIVQKRGKGGKAEGDR